MPRRGRWSAAATGSVRVWDPVTAERLTELTGYTGWAVSAMALLPGPDDAYLIVTGRGDGLVRVWDPVTADQLTELTGHTGGVNAVAVLAGLGGAHRIGLWWS